MLICNKCGYLSSEVPTQSWKHTELEGAYYEHEDAPCDCGGEFVEAVECDNCGEYEAEGDLINGWCRCCAIGVCETYGLDLKKDRGKLFDIIEEAIYEKVGI